MKTVTQYLANEQMVNDRTQISQEERDKQESLSLLDELDTTQATKIEEPAENKSHHCPCTSYVNMFKT